MKITKIDCVQIWLSPLKYIEKYQVWGGTILKWFHEGLNSRIDGPAVIWEDNDKNWFVKNKNYPLQEEEYWND
ncbi:MAG: hypothetical protein AABY22_24045 [Nanoarchaeota archaeon]